MFLQKNDRILFFGDSITDCGRNRESTADDGLGGGYVRLCQALLQTRYPDLELTVINRGISGNRIYDLEERLQKDVLDQNPSVVSFLIGINDTWRAFDSKVPSPVSDFSESFHRVLTALKDKGIRLVICEPFLQPVPPDRAAWREDLDPRIHAIRSLAVEFSALYLPLDGIFAQAATRRPGAYWLPDGVHPTAAGHGLIADNWMRLVAG